MLDDRLHSAWIPGKANGSGEAHEFCCPYCRRWVHLPIDHKILFDYKYCPYCGREIVKEDK